MDLTYHIPSAMTSAKSHWLLLFPSQSGHYPKVISRLEGTMLLISPSLRSWSLFMFVCEITSSLIISGLLEGCHIYFQWKILAKNHHIVCAPAFIASYWFVLYIPWFHLWLPNPQHFLSASFCLTIIFLFLVYFKHTLSVSQSPPWGSIIFTPPTTSQNRLEAAA